MPKHAPQYQSFWPKNYNPREEAKMPKLTPPKAKPKKFALKPDKPFIPTEYAEQEKIFLWAHGRPAERRAVRTKQGLKYYWEPAIPAVCKDPRIQLMFATLNGLRLPIGQARKASRAGMRKAVPDIWLPVRKAWLADEPVPGLVIELKRLKGGHLDEDQKAYHELLREQGYKVVVCKGAYAAIEEIERYLE